MTRIGLYEIMDDKPIVTSSAMAWKARKNNEYFFLKEYNNPSRPSEELGAELVRVRNEKCERFEKKRRRINEAIRGVGGGNFVAPVDFFLYERKYYQATPWRHAEKKTVEEVARLSDAEKLLILKTAANSMKLLHEHGIIHCDIKMDNLPVTITKSNILTCSLIDFDTAVEEQNIPASNEVGATEPFMSPELASYKLNRGYYGDYKFGVESDVFSLAIVFHQYWSGEKFSYPEPARGPYLYNAVLEGVPISVSKQVPEWLEVLLRRMIDKLPENRPSMREVLEYLKGIGEQSPTKVVGSDPSEVKVSTYSKGENFPEDAESFEVLPNGNVKFVYKDGSKMALKLPLALNRKYIK